MVLLKTTRWAAILLLSFFSLAISAQGIITVENFETYTAGARLCSQAPAYWFTWNNGPGTAEDPIVTDSLAYEGTRSLKVTGTNDVLLDLAGKTTGRFEVSFYMRIPAGKTGFYGLLHNFAGNESDWGAQCFFDLSNQGTVDAGGTPVAFIYNNDQWIPVKNIIDLDNDHAEIYISQVLVTEWQWSKGLSGSPGLSRLGALNFFAWNAEQRQPEAYIDSVLYMELPAPDPPRNLTAVVNGNDITLTWEPPATGTPEGYKIYRDSTVISPLQTGLTYVDANIYPGSYTYSVKAVYSSGMSQPAGPVPAVVEGGTQRKFVLLEIATGTWCTYCPGASMGADDLVNNGQDVAVIEYHDNDDYSNPDSDARNTFYNVPGFPTAHFDGLHPIAAGNMTQSMYPVYLPVYNQRIPKLSLFDLELGVTQVSGNHLQVNVTATKIYPYAGASIRLNLVLTESHIPEIWQTNMTEVNYVCRKMYPDHNGMAADFSADSTVSLDYDISVDTSWDFNKCELVAFLQDYTSKEVLQVEKVKLGALGIEDPQGITISTWPNPASGVLNVSSDVPLLAITILDMSGRSIMQVQPGNHVTHIGLTGLEPGMYFLQMMTSRGPVVRKVLVARN